MKRMIQNQLWRFISLVFVLFTATAVQAITKTWDGGGLTTAWTNNANWNPDGAPAANDVVIIDGAVTVDMKGLGFGFLPSGVTVVLTNGATLYNSVDVCRMNGSSTIRVAANCDISDYWAMYQGSISFQNGAKWTTGDLELSGPNVFSFKLGPSGFTKLTPSILRWDTSKKFTQQTWTVDMSDYTGGPASILLVDCSGASDANMTASNFWYTATRIVTNSGIYTGSTIVYDEAQKAFVLKVSQTPITYPPVADLIWDGGASGSWTNSLNWDPDLLPVAGNSVLIDGAVTVDQTGSDQNLPQYSKVTLTNGATLTRPGGALRMNYSTINVASNCILTGNHWDLAAGSLNFQNGAKATMSNFELRSSNVLSFRIGPSGFTTLMPGTLYGQAAEAFSKLTVRVDMSDYTGGPATIMLMDFTVNGHSSFLTRDSFLSGATRIITNSGSYSNSIVYFDAVRVALVLRVSEVPITPPLADYVWDGGASGSWTNSLNWDPDLVPAANSTVIIDGAVKVNIYGLVDGSLPYGVKISLTNGATLGNLTDGSATRMNGAGSINVAPNCVLTNTWVLYQGSLNFQDGAKLANPQFWMQDSFAKTLNFKLGLSGFTTLTNGGLFVAPDQATSVITNLTCIADMANYAGSTGVVTLIDFAGDNYGTVSNANFQTAKLSVTNTDGYVGNLQWNDSKEAIELNITGAPVYYWDCNGTDSGFGTAGGTWTSPTMGDTTQGWSTNVDGTTLPVSMATTVRSSVNFGSGAITLGAGTLTVSGSVTNKDMTFAPGSGSITLSGGTITLAPSATITVNNSSDTISSVLAGIGSSLTKAGSGTLTLSGVNTYTGSTLINGGTLALGANNVLTNASPLFIGSATLDAGTYSNKLGTLDAAATAVINLDAGATLAFADSSAIDWTGGTLKITGLFVTGVSIRFGTTVNGLTAAQLAKISAPGCFKFTLDANGYLKAQRGTLIMFQ